MLGAQPTGVAQAELDVARRACEALAAGEQRRDLRLRIAGRIAARRVSSSKLSWYDVSRGSQWLQVCASQRNHADGAPGFAQMLAALHVGDVVAATGWPGRSHVGEPTLYATGIQLLAPCLRPLPAVLPLERSARLMQPAAELMAHGTEPVRARARLLRALRAFLDSRGFVECETPVLSTTVGGAAARPFVTRMDAGSREMFLRIAPELYLKELLIGGVDRVYEIGKQFRNEDLDARHHPEFTTCEFYQAYTDDLERLMHDTEELLRQLADAVVGRLALCMPLLCREMRRRTGTNAAHVDLARPFQRVSLPYALEHCLGEPLAPLLSRPDRLAEHCRRLGVPLPQPPTVARLVGKLIGALVEPDCIQPTFLTDHPLVLSPLAKRHPTLPGMAARFELMLAGMEICNAYVELNDPQEQRARFQQQWIEREQGDLEAQLPNERFCAALEYGMPPAVGWGLGIDRLLMLLLGAPRLRSVLPFAAVSTTAPPKPAVDHGRPAPVVVLDTERAAEDAGDASELLPVGMEVGLP